jgi:hypothetical protein
MPSTVTSSNFLLEPMTVLKKFMSGQIALWCAFWLIGVPLAFLWDVSGACTIVGCGIQDPAIGGLLLALFAVLSIAIPFVSFAIWRSSSNYPQKTRWRTAVALGAKLCAVLSGLLALIGLAVLLYIGYYIFIYPVLDHA